MTKRKMAEERQVAFAALSPLLEETLRLGGTAELTATGNSMRPMMLHRRSKIRLAALTAEPKRGDVLLYRRRDGHYVLHRLIEAGDTLTMCGDAQWHPEPGIERSQVLAILEAFSRKGKRWVSCDAGHYRAYWRFWLAIRPLRRLVFGGSRRLLRELKRLFGSRGLRKEHT